MLILLSLLALSQTPVAGRPMILDCASDSAASEFVFVTTPSGIRRFDRNTGVWTSLRVPGSPIGFLGLNGDSLWVITPKGAASASVRGDRWQPCRIPGRVRSLAFAGSHMWAGGDSGLLSLDVKTRVWRQRAEFAVNDMVYSKDRLWIASAAGAFRYNLESDLIDELPAPESAYGRVVATSSRAWFLSDRRFAVYRPDIDSTRVFAAVPITGYASVGDSLFVVSRGAAFLYEPVSGKWIELADTLPLRKIEAVSAEGGSLWFATDAGLRRYNASGSARQAWTRKDGPADDSLLAVYADPRFVYTVSRRNIQVLDRKQNTWKVVSLSEPRRFFDFLKPRR